MYLTQVFLKEYYKKKSANDALIKCNQTLCRRMKGKKNTKGCLKYFFYLDKDGHVCVPSEKCVELMAFWELYREVATDSDMLEVKDLWIMQILFEVACLETLWENQNLKKRLSPKESMNLQMLVEEIHRPISKKYLVLLRPAKEKYSIWKKVDLNRFIDGAIFAEKENVENHIISIMRVGGIVAWVVGREGLTPQRIYGYKVHGESCEECSPEYLDTLRDTITANNELAIMAERKGNLAGYIKFVAD